MAIPGDTAYRVIAITNAADGTAKTDAVIGDLTVTANRIVAGGSWGTWTHGATLTHLGSGLYGFAYALPPNAAWWDIRLSAAGLTIWPAGWAGQTLNYDNDRLFGAIARPVATLTSSAQLGAELPLKLVAYRYRVLGISVLDSAGNAIPLDGYNNWRIAIRTANGERAWESGTGTYRVTDLTLGGTSGGVLTGTIPESLTTATPWPATTAVTRGDVVQAGDLTAICTAAGTTGSTQPTWPAEGLTVVDGTATWRVQFDPYSLIDAAVENSASEVSGARWEITADQDANPARTVPVIRTSPLQIVRTEVATQYPDWS